MLPQLIPATPPHALVFAVATRPPIGDTQTGLRAFRPELHDWLQSIDGDRFEYELHTLLRAKRDGVEIVEVPIETIYLDQNASSHFRPLLILRSGSTGRS
ncbi:MAG: hypothetical protein R2710_06095 [Acidimicrobiales bacterium]